MISVILYGRNDSYGYNLHKRAVIGLNTLATVLTDPTDEIVFVDYNSPDDLPTFPEAIRDLLTEAVRARLRVIRVRHRVHRRLRRDSPLELRESLARNIAIRRARPENRWILSTNPDMVFVPRQGASLSQVAAGLTDGYYALPRFEMPEALWESADRLSPERLRETFAAWGRDLQLDEVVTARSYQVFDAPGDFQLFPRQAIEAIAGFDEGMIYGWHVDSNLGRRMELYFGRLRSLAAAFAGYHCDHTRLATLCHAADRTENDFARNCGALTRPELPDQAATWGLPEADFEEIRLANAPAPLATALGQVFGDRPADLPPVPFLPDSYNGHPYYNTRHALPYLADQLVPLPPDTRLAYCGANAELLGLLRDFCDRTGRRRPIVYHQGLMAQAGPEAVAGLPDGCLATDAIDRLAAADLFVIDTFCRPETAVRNRHGHRVMGLTADSLETVVHRVRVFLELARREQRALKLGRAPRKFLILGVLNSLYVDLYSRVVGLAAVPFSCHYQHGFVRQEADIDGPLAVATFLGGLGRAGFARLDAVIRDICQAPAGTTLDFAAAFDRLERLLNDPDRRAVWCAAGPDRSPSLPHLACLLLYALAGRFTEACIVYAKFWKDPSLIPDKLLSAADRGGTISA